MNKTSVTSVGREKISVLQFSFLIITVILATADVFLPALVAQQAGRDSWFSVIIGTIISIIIVNIFISLALKYPDKTFVEYSCDILGKPLGKLAGGIFLYYIFIIACISTRNLGEIFVIAFNPKTPIAVFIITIILLAAYAVGKGIETISRMNEILLPVGIMVLIGISALNFKELDFNYFLPIMYDGIIPPLRGSILIQAWMIETIIILQLMPFLKDKKKIRSSVTASLVVVGLGLQIGVLIIALFGLATKFFMFPALEFVRYASFGENFRGIDITIMSVWLGGAFIKISAFTYIFIMGLAQLINIKSHKDLIVPGGVLIATYSMVFSRNVMEETYFIGFIKPFYSLSVVFLLPTLLLLVSTLRKNT